MSLEEEGEEGEGEGYDVVGEAMEENVTLRMRIVELETENRVLKAQVKNQHAMLTSLQDAIMQAAMSNIPDIPDISSSESLINTAIIRDECDMVVALLEAGPRGETNLDSALQCACQHRRSEIVEILLERGADLHADHDCALMWACDSGDVRIVRILMKHGANPDALHGLPLRIAVGSGNVDIVRALRR